MARWKDKSQMRRHAPAINQCAGKKAYPNWQHAKNDAAALRGKHDDSVTEPYHCRHCGMVHVGNSQRRKDRRE